MRTARTLTAALILTAALAGCSGGNSDPKPTPTPATPKQIPTSTSAPATSADASAHASASAAPGSSPAPGAGGSKNACVASIVDQAAKDPRRLQPDPRPAGCEGLEDATYLEAYYEALKKINEKGRTELGGGSTGG